MVEIKENVLERKKSVIALYLMGNTPEKISEKLAMPLARVKKDLKNMGIKNIEEHLKSKEQINYEIRHEIEILKNELWSLYFKTNNIEEKIKIIAEIRALIDEKSKNAKEKPNQEISKAKNTYEKTYEKSLWQEVKENFFSQREVPKKPEQPKQKETLAIIPQNKACFIEAPIKETKISKDEKSKEKNEKMIFSDKEENPTKNYVFSEKYKGECEKDQENMEIEEILKKIELEKRNLQLKQTQIPKISKESKENYEKEKTIKEKIESLEKEKQERKI